MKIIMYHYVRPKVNQLPYLKYLPLDVFSSQLDYFSEHYGIISRTDFFTAIDKGISPSGVVLTFDDGFSDHADYVLPELERRGLWGIFYIPTGSYSERTDKLLGVHRLHWLVGKYGADEIMKRTMPLIREEMLDTETIEAFDKEIYTYTDYDESDKQVRRLFNYYISYNWRDEILSELMRTSEIECEIAEKFYLSAAQINKVISSGSIIGSHTKSHRVLSRLDEDGQRDEIGNSVRFIASLGQDAPHCFAYPYGYKTSYNDTTLRILEQEGVHNAVVFDNAELTTPFSRYELSREDCNKFMVPIV